MCHTENRIVYRHSADRIYGQFLKYCFLRR
nr:MAG TPA: hypothetical protein [Caudoviricetes sp.]